MIRFMERYLRVTARMLHADRSQAAGKVIFISHLGQVSIHTSRIFLVDATLSKRNTKTATEHLGRQS